MAVGDVDALGKSGDVLEVVEVVRAVLSRREAYSCIMEEDGPGGGGRTLNPVLALRTFKGFESEF
jgi:hypothetical protein